MKDDEVAALVRVLLADFPGMENDPDFLEKAAVEVSAGRDADVAESQRSAVAAELRRRALRLRNPR